MKYELGVYKGDFDPRNLKIVTLQGEEVSQPPKIIKSKWGEYTPIILLVLLFVLIIIILIMGIMHDNIAEEYNNLIDYINDSCLCNAFV